MARVELPPDLAALSGRVGDVVYTRRASGTFVRPYTRPPDPQSAGQRSQQARVAQTAHAWRQLSAEQVTAWEEWARAHPRRNDVTGEEYAPTAFNAFASLTLKWLQVNPSGAPPGWPPVAAFTGGGVSVTATAGAGGIAWTASGPCPPGVVIELLTQPLAKVNSRPNKERYRTALWWTAADAPFAVSTPAPRGLYAPAYRCVNVETGQATALTELPAVWAPGEG